MNVLRPKSPCPEVFYIEDSQLIKKLKIFSGFYRSQVPELNEGDKVGVILNERNRTHLIGIIHKILWHQKDEKYTYYLSVSGKKISKRYFAEDLKKIE